MLHEFPKVRQEAGSFRRLFTDEYFDLYVWYRRKRGPILGFQLCYDKGQDYRALTWTRAGSYRHEGVHEGGVGGNPLTPVLVADGLFDQAVIAARFLAEARLLPRSMRRLVYRTLLRYEAPAEPFSAT